MTEPTVWVYSFLPMGEQSNWARGEKGKGKSANPEIIFFRFSRRGLLLASRYGPGTPDDHSWRECTSNSVLFVLSKGGSHRTSAHSCSFLGRTGRTHWETERATDIAKRLFSGGEKVLLLLKILEQGTTCK